MSLHMDSVTSPTLFLRHPPLEFKDENGKLVFDSSLLQKQPNLPREFVWPDAVIPTQIKPDELQEPLIDLAGFLRGDQTATAHAAELIRTACLSHGFFQVTNHGIDAALIRAAYDETDAIFKLPIGKKRSIRTMPGSIGGYSGAHAERFSSKLPWKETFSFGFHANGSDREVVSYFNDVLGEDFEHSGWVYQKYCEAMRELCLVIMELLGISLGVERLQYRNYFEDCSSIMRCNNYPPCKVSGHALGTGPHCDPTSLTILYQDQVGGLEVFANGKWQAVRPRPDALVINIGDTFMALSNGKYKSCLHRAVVSREAERKSLVFFVSPKEDKVVRPPEDLIGREGPRKYPDFTWSDLFEFTQKHYRADAATLQSFVPWLLSSKSI